MVVGNTIIILIVIDVTVVFGKVRDYIFGGHEIVGILVIVSTIIGGVVSLVIGYEVLGISVIELVIIIIVVVGENVGVAVLIVGHETVGNEVIVSAIVGVIVARFTISGIAVIILDVIVGGGIRDIIFRRKMVGIVVNSYYVGEVGGLGVGDIIIVLTGSTTEALNTVVGIMVVG